MQASAYRSHHLVIYAAVVHAKYFEGLVDPQVLREEFLKGIEIAHLFGGRTHIKIQLVHIEVGDMHFRVLAKRLKHGEEASDTQTVV